MQTEMILFPSRLKYSSLVAIGLIGIAISVLILSEDNWFGWVCLPFSSACVLVSIWAMLSPRFRLYLDSSGLSYATMKKDYAYEWRDIAWFSTVRLATTDYVSFGFAPGFDGDVRIREVNQRFGGFDRFLPDTYGLRADELAKLLEEWRSRHTSS